MKNILRCVCALVLFEHEHANISINIRFKNIEFRHLISSIIGGPLSIYLQLPHQKMLKVFSSCNWCKYLFLNSWCDIFLFLLRIKNFVKWKKLLNFDSHSGTVHISLTLPIENAADPKRKFLAMLRTKTISNSNSIIFPCIFDSLSLRLLLLFSWANDWK